MNCGLQVDQDGYCCATSGGNDLPALADEPHAATVETATEDKAHTVARDGEDASGDEQNVADYLEEDNEEGDDLMSICVVSEVTSEVSSELSELSEAQSFPDDFLSDDEAEFESHRERLSSKLNVAVQSKEPP